MDTALKRSKGPEDATKGGYDWRPTAEGPGQFPCPTVPNNGPADSRLLHEEPFGP